ncbi:MAG: DUF4147 domain-containing protein [Erysipelotrichaceae bacterium]|nr:DUF4147 domain-containing protein [Erysipelotrichaceae bacterium]
MKEKLHQDALKIIEYSLKKARPDENILKILKDMPKGKGKEILVSVGKGAFAMAKTALECRSFDQSVILTKYGYLEEKLKEAESYEAGHPLLDENGIKASERILEITEDLDMDDTVFFLLSGGASALFEVPAIPLEELQRVNGELLKKGADIKEINTIRKRLSLVKGGRFAVHCAPARVITIVLSDVLGDPLDVIGSGPTVPDRSKSREAIEIADKYSLSLSEEGRGKLEEEPVKQLHNSEVCFAGNLSMFIEAAREKCEELGYETRVLKDYMTSKAGDHGRRLAEEALKISETGRKTALIQGGEPVVIVKGNGMGGRAQELALSAARIIEGRDIAVFSYGSDGTDGPTDADGGYVDGDTALMADRRGIDITASLDNNDAYHALKELDGLIMTGPTGTNVNDLAVVLISGEEIWQKEK